MQKKSRLITKVSIVILLIITILISTMPYKPKIIDDYYSSELVRTMASEKLSEQSQIVINKVDSKTEEKLGGVKFELKPLELDLLNQMRPITKYKISYWDGEMIVKTVSVNEGSSSYIIDYDGMYFEGWSTIPNSTEVVFKPGETIKPEGDMNLYAVIIPKELTSFEKKVVQVESEVPVELASKLYNITYPENKSVEFTDSNPSITLLYKITATGENGFKYTITDDNATHVFGDEMIGVIPETGQVSLYVTRTFTVDDINENGVLENIAYIRPGIDYSYASSSIETVEAEDKSPKYTVIYNDGTPDGSVFSEKVFSGLKHGQRLPEFTGRLERDEYVFQGWAPALNSTVTYDVTYYATWKRIPDLTVTTGPKGALYANVGDTLMWYITIKNSEWQYAEGVRIESVLSNGKAPTLSEDTVNIAAGGQVIVYGTYVATEEDAGKTLRNSATIIETSTGKRFTYGASESRGITVLEQARTEMISESSSIETAYTVKPVNVETPKDNVVSLNQTSELLTLPESRLSIINRNEYNFIQNGDGSFKSSNTGIQRSTSTSCIPIDLTEYSGEYYLEINASISSEEYYDYGYVRLLEETKNGIDYDDTTKEFINISGEIENTDYGISIEGGKKYILIFGYSKDPSYDEGEDTFTINSVKIILNSLGIKEKMNLETDINGKAIIQVPNGRYLLTEISTLEWYKILEYPITIEVQNNQIKIIDNQNLNDNISVLDNGELRIENTTCRVIVHHYIKNYDGTETDIKVIEDKVIKGLESEKYSVEPQIHLEKDGIEYELEYEIKNGKRNYIRPKNETGYFGKEDIHVNYYYKSKKQITINKIWEDNNNSAGIRPESVKVTLTAMVEDENGNEIQYPLNNIETTVELKEKDEWTYTWRNLETHDENGEELMYVVEEIEVPESYYSVVSLVDYEHYDITNYKCGSIKIIKVDSQDSNIKLSGAEFKLEMLIYNGEEFVVNEYFEPLYVTTSSEDNIGEATFENLVYGKYRLTEIKAPNGYSLQKKPIDIEITQEMPDYVGEVINREKTVFPDTGGNGSVILTMMGVFLIAIAIKIKE